MWATYSTLLKGRSMKILSDIKNGPWRKKKENQHTVYICLKINIQFQITQ